MNKKSVKIVYNNFQGKKEQKSENLQVFQRLKYKSQATTPSLSQSGKQVPSCLSSVHFTSPVTTIK